MRQGLGPGDEVIQKYSELIRTTIGEHLAEEHPQKTIEGIYIIACYPSYGCLYVGISNNIKLRLMQHLLSGDDIGVFLRDNMAVSCGWRLDILIAPENRNKREWMRQAEKLLVNRFHPLLNTQHVN